MRNLKCLLNFFIVIILIISTSCNESPTAFLGDIIGSGSSSPLNVLLNLTTVVPSNGALDVPINSNRYAVIFNKQVNTATLIAANVQVSEILPLVVPLTMGAGNDFTVTTSAGDTIATINFINAYATLPGTTTFQVTLTAGITDTDATPTVLQNPGSFTFATGIVPDATQPNLVGGSNNPTSPPVVFLTDAQRLGALPSQEIHIDFDKATIDPSTVNNDTFYLHDGTSKVPATYTFSNPLPTTTRATLTPTVNLTPNTVYTVWVSNTLNDIKDLAGNILAGVPFNWTFTTTATPLDPVGGLPGITSGPFVDDVSINDALISWTTNKPTNYTLNYGLGPDMTNSTAGGFSDYHAVTLPGLTSNHRYWFRIDFQDVIANAGSSATLQFNTEDNEATTTVHGGAGNQNSAYTIPAPTGGVNGFFLFWQNGTSVYGQRYNSTLTTNANWNGGAAQQIFPVNYTYRSSAEDNAGGVIVVADNAGLSYAKRLRDVLSFDWGGTAASAGFQFRGIAVATGNPSAVVVNGSPGDRVLYVWEEGGNAFGRIMDLTGSPPAEQVAVFQINGGVGAQTVRTVTDGAGSAYVVYLDISGGQFVRIRYVQGNGNQPWGVGSISADTQLTIPETIVDVKSDNAGGVIILYKYNNDLHAQRVYNNAGAPARDWGANGVAFDNDGAATITSQEIFSIIPPNDVLFVVNINNNIWARRMTGTTGANVWGPTQLTATGAAYNPKVFVNGANTIIAWQDNRFVNPPATYLNTGYGIFGLKINVASGVIDPTWYANDSGANDTNGVSIILKRLNYTWPNPLIAPYNGGTQAVLIWEDYRAGAGSDLLYMILSGFNPP